MAGVDYIFYLLILTSIVYLLVSKYLFGYKTYEKPGEYDSKRNGSLNSL